MTADELKRIREHTGWSLDAFAKRTGISRATLIRYEQGRSKISMAYAFMVKTKYSVDNAE